MLNEAKHLRSNLKRPSRTLDIYFTVKMYVVINTVHHRSSVLSSHAF